MTGSRKARGRRPAIGLLLCGLAAQAAMAADGVAPAVPSFLANVPLATLDATRDRPIFLPARRPPAPPAQAPAAPPIPAPVQARVDEPPRLTLLGIVRAPQSEGAAVVMDETDRTSLSLKPGESRRGWIVRAIGGDTVTLEKQDRTVRLSFAKAPPPAPLLPAE